MGLLFDGFSLGLPRLEAPLQIDDVGQPDMHHLVASLGAPASDGTMDQILLFPGQLCQFLGKLR